jgi:hypothetical protein
MRPGQSYNDLRKHNIFGTHAELHGVIAPDGQFHKLDAKQGHYDFIFSKMKPIHKKPKDTDQEYENHAHALKAGWIPLAHAGANSFSVHKDIAKQKTHPAMVTLRNMMKDQGYPFVANIHNDKAWESRKEAEPQKFHKYGTFSKSEGAREVLQKGAMHRLAPHPNKPLDEQLRNDVAQWQKLAPTSDRPELRAHREALPRMEGADRKRALHRMAKETKVKQVGGKLHFLLHRGMSKEEHDFSVGHGFVGHQKHSSWTPRYETAANFGYAYTTDHGKPNEVKGKVVSAWISEDHIHHVPMQIGHTGSKRGKNPFDNEHEIIVSPHTSKVHAVAEGEFRDGKSLPPQNLDEHINLKARRAKTGGRAFVEATIRDRKR